MINLFRHGDFRNAAAVIRDVVAQKCRFKHIPFPTFESLAPAQPELIGEWGNMLGPQLPSPPPVHGRFELDMDSRIPVLT